jgi:hypothetical protein
MIEAHGHPALERLLAVGHGRGREDRDTGPAAAGGSKETRVELGHVGQKLPTSDERDWSWHRDR